MTVFDANDKRILRRASDHGAVVVTKTGLAEAVVLVQRGDEIKETATAPRKTVLGLYKIGALQGPGVLGGAVETYSITDSGRALLARLLKESP